MTRVADAHVDVLLRMQEERVEFHGASPCEASASELNSGNVKLQVFALYVSPRLSPSEQLERVLGQIDLFYEKVVKPGRVRAIVSGCDLDLAQSHGEIGAMLSLEGGGCLNGQLALLRTLHRLGVRGVGLTHNPANQLADGCREPRGAGLTRMGRDILQEMARFGMWADLSHLSDQGVDEVLSHYEGPIMASHANARAVYNHPRNLTDSVIRDVFAKGGWMGLTFEASFVEDAQRATVDDLFRHLEHLLSIGGEDHVGFGSDFDGTENPLPGLRNAADYASFAEVLERRYGTELADKLLFGNFLRYLQIALPA